MAERRVTTVLRQAVSLRAHGCCEYCKSQARFATETFAVEHVIPRHLGGATELSNLAFSCFGCNSHKYTKIKAIDPQTGKETPLFHPRQQVWREHFAWDQAYTVIVGLTDVGRATVALLQMNRPELLNLRRVLYLVNEHPLE